ncbi:hypothetical protein I203_107197 [Kwoniella mangroviensis CBS 8507]|uniref:hypothetical protein n=1 Tax=Kwoniella mangroviensis CBS 8507 TaxID=1296122 RepID=UPI00080D0923|nr:uncharacterized protein I203_01945 [Kwoniella mangroviensis CBS 8507]OCF68562.1 hypothetical protein I203_01945 [Kwoniella mangroviensis CBS 8507]
MPTRPSTYEPHVLSLIQSTSYPPLPSVHSLEEIRGHLLDHNKALSAAAAAASGNNLGQSKKEEKRKRKEREDEERERAALEANEKAGMRLEALERARVESQRQKAASPGSVRVKRERTSLSPAPSNASSASFRPGHGHGTPITYGGHLKKKKTKRVLDSDDEAASQARDRSVTHLSPPPPLGHHMHPHQSSTSGLKLKLSQSHPLSHSKHSRPPTEPSPTPPITGPSSHIDFSLPSVPVRPLIPPRPGVQKPMKPGPKKQSEVDEDFSNAKAPSQVAFPTFWSGVEPYLRDVREDDLAMLGFKADAPESYEIPARGRHYTEIWDEEDGNPPGTTPRLPVPNLRQQQILQQSNGPPTLPHFVPTSELRDDVLVDEQRGLGSLTERVVAAVVGRLGFGEKREKSDNSEKQDTSALEAEMADREPAKVDVVDLEERMKKELKAVMLLGEHDEYDPSNREDDEITSALRQSQRLLVQQTALNEARKSRLAEIAKQRLAYNEYQNLLEGIEKSIESGWAKRIKKYGSTPNKKNAHASGSSSKPPVPENLKKFVATRQHWLDTVGQLMKERPRGQVVGIPSSSIFEGIGEDEEKDERYVEDQIMGLMGDEMDIDENENDN